MSLHWCQMPFEPPGRFMAKGPNDHVYTVGTSHAKDTFIGRRFQKDGLGMNAASAIFNGPQGMDAARQWCEADAAAGAPEYASQEYYAAHD